MNLDPWELIDFNFPGIKTLYQSDAKLAYRNVNWYLSEYLGCEVSNDTYNFAFSSGLTKGRGVHKGGKIFLPVSAESLMAVSSCQRIEIRNDSKFPVVAMVLQQVGGSMPSEARCLDGRELAFAKLVYQNSLADDDIYVSDGVGGGGNPFTIALPANNRWIVLLNLGPTAFDDPGSYKKSLLIHELAHAWQSQHHPKPWQFMVNCTESNAAAAVATKIGEANRNRWVKIVTNTPNLGIDKASAYAYLPGLPFGEYGGEQIAEQVEDFFYPPADLEPGKQILLSKIWSHITSVPVGKSDPDNLMSLDKVRFDFKNTPGVVWSDGY
jgi:hypothetical protein